MTLQLGTANPHKRLCRHEYRYCVLDAPEISDAAFARLMNRLKEIEADYTRLTTLGRWLSPVLRSP